MAGRSLPFHTHQFVSCLFLSELWKICLLLQLSLTLTLTLHTWISFHFFSGRQRSPLGLYHSLHNHLRHPDDRRLGKKGRRVDPDLALGFSPVLRSKATESCRRLSSGGIPRCSRLCPWENGRNACVKHCFVVHLRSLSTHSSICFYFAVAFLHSGQRGFQLLLVRSSFFV